MELELSTEHFELGTTNDFVTPVALSNPEAWQPRWYYIMRNKTSGKLYAGQTTAKNMDWYCGSGRYWVPHCNKHGGYDRTNIEVVEQTWFTEESDAQAWLDRLEARVPDYWCGNPQWANRILESTESSPFAGASEYQKRNQRERIKNKTHNFLNSEMQAQLATKSSVQRIAHGTHNWLGGDWQSKQQRERVENKTHNWLGGEFQSKLQRDRVENGTHHFLNSEIQRQTNSKRIENGTHNFLDPEFHARLNRDMTARGIHSNQQKARLKAFYQAATGKTVSTRKIYKGCPEELELQALGYDTHAIRYGLLKWPEAA